MNQLKLNRSSLTGWQREQLKDLPKEGIDCLLKTWATFAEEKHNNDEVFCNSTYDGVACWSYAPANTTIIRSCAEVFDEDPELRVAPGQIVVGNAIRICAANGSWLWGNWTNYTECADNFDYDDSPRRNLTFPLGGREEPTKEAVRYILFIGSILSVTLLTISLIIFFYFRSLRCDRITVHIHLMTSLCIRFILLIVITEPFIFGRKDNYRSVDGICKTVVSLLMYATVASINWMFIQGHYLHGRLTTNIFDRGTPLKTYYAIGWGLPFILIGIWAFVMEKNYSVYCWEGMVKLPYIWIIVGPVLLALFVNLMFLINIVRVLLTKVQRSTAITEVVQFRRAVKATLVLFPLLGINNLLYVYNPGGEYTKYYMLAYAILQSSQGIFVSILFCFLSSDVRDAIRREYLKFRMRRSANSSGGASALSRYHQKSFTNATSVTMMMTPRSTPGGSGYKRERNDEESCIGNNTNGISGTGTGGDETIGFINASPSARENHQKPPLYSISFKKSDNNKLGKSNCLLSPNVSPDSNNSIKKTCSAQNELDQE